MSPFLAVLLLLLISGICLYTFVSVQPATLARAIRTFTATFAALAGTGLLLTGRIGLAIITVSAAIMALRALQESMDPVVTVGPDPAALHPPDNLVLEKIPRSSPTCLP